MKPETKKFIREKKYFDKYIGSSFLFISILWFIVYFIKQSDKYHLFFGFAWLALSLMCFMRLHTLNKVLKLESTDKENI